MTKNTPCGAGLAVTLALAFAWMPSQAAPAYKILHNFTPPRAGERPNSGLAEDSAGNLYGTAAGGGRFGWGIVFRLGPPGPAGRTYAVIYDFRGQPDAGVPDSAPVIDASGQLYGTAGAGGGAGLGAVWRLTPPASGRHWTESVLHSFAGPTASPPDGATPQDTLLLGPDGTVYGTTAFGGAANMGTVFSLTPPLPGQAWAETVLHDFAGGPTDGAIPIAGLYRDPAGRLAGTTYSGGIGPNGGNGTIFRLSPGPGKTWTQDVTYTFSGGPTDGAMPASQPIADASGTLYGTTSAGGTQGGGTVWTLAPDGTETIIANLGGGRGAQCFAGLVADAAGNLFGTAYAGGANHKGTVFELTDDPKRGWLETVLWSFQGVPDGANPFATLVRKSNGALFGTTFKGGPAGVGTVFEVTPARP